MNSLTFGANTSRLAKAHAGPSIGSSLNDELRRVLIVVGAADLHFLPAAAFVVGDVSLTFMGFAVVVTAGWLASTSLQVVVLRHVRRRLGAASTASRRVEFMAVASVGIALHLLVDRLNVFALQLGLDAGDGWGTVIGAWTVVLVSAYLVWEREARARQARAAQRLVDVQQAQIRLRRGLVDTQLRAMQARVDPRFFFATLDTIEQFYRREPPRAEALFDELVGFLRTALPNVGEGSSVLARELELATTYLRVDALATGRERSLAADLPPEILGSPFPAGVLLPLLRAALEAQARGCDAANFTLMAKRTGSATGPVLRVEIVLPSALPNTACQGVRESLRARFGDATTLLASTTEPARLELRIPHEP